jgi:hypothetical protein
MLTFNIGRKEAIFFGAVILVFVVAGLAIAYTSDGSGNPAVMGHSLEEMSLPDCLNGQALVKTATGWDCGNAGMIFFIAGSINADGTIRDGTGFTVAKTGTGRYTINLLSSFSSMPAVVLTGFIGPGGPAGPNYAIVSRSTSSVDVQTHCVGSGDCDLPFSFIATESQP